MKIDFEKFIVENAAKIAYDAFREATRATRGIMETAEAIIMRIQEVSCATLCANFAAHVVKDAQAAHDALGSDKDTYLLLGAKLALEVLEKLGSPGCQWINKEVV